MEDIKTDFLCELVAHFNWADVLDLGTTPHGGRRVVMVKDGTFEGPKLKGILLPGEGDWYIRRPDGAVELDVRIVLRTDDNQLIYVYYRGINETKPELAIKMISGEAVDPSQYYFRITPVFETASEKYAWLNRVVSVGTGRILPTGLAYRIYQVL